MRSNLCKESGLTCCMTPSFFRFIPSIGTDSLIPISWESLPGLGFSICKEWKVANKEAFNLRQLLIFGLLRFGHKIVARIDQSVNKDDMIIISFCLILYPVFVVHNLLVTPNKSSNAN